MPKYNRLIMLVIISLILILPVYSVSFGTINVSSSSAQVNLFINGTTFNDLNGDGLKTKDEPGLPGWTLILKRGDEVLLQATTDNEGLFSFKNLEPGNYTLIENMRSGWNQTTPGKMNYTINLVDKDAINCNFGNIFGSVTYVPQRHPIMSKNAWNQRTQAINNLPKTGTSTQSRAGVIYPSSFSLLSHVPYTPSQRDQGSCGDCWVWGCTAPIEVAHDIQNGVLDRLSIQYLNSNYNGGSGSSWACCGGWEVGFQNFYRTKGKFIPWSNSNANFRDGGRGCSAGTSVPSGSISTSPNYPITSIRWHEIQTTGVSTAQAISSIKSYLYTNKAVTLGFYLPDFTPFWNFWGSNSGNWNPDNYCGLSDGAYPGGHEVTVVGWNDSTDSWIVLNSWGVDSAHSDGTYKLKMDMNYTCANGGYYSYSFGYFDVAFSNINVPPNTPSIPSGPNSCAVGTSYSYATSATDPDGDQVKYTLDWGDLTTSETSLVNSGTIASVSHSWSKGGTYQVKAMATDSKGLPSTDWSNPLSVSVTDSSTGATSVALQASNGQYVCAEDSGGQQVVANRNAIGAWETFKLIDRGNGNYALQASNGQYVCAEDGGGQQVVANRNAIGAWETFKLIDRGNGNYALQAANGQYVCAEGSGGDGVVANRNAIGAWETFRFLDLSRPANVALQAANGQYVCAEGSGGDGVVANRNAIGPWETFKLIDRGNGNVALQASNGQYVCAEGGGGQQVVANRNAISAWETFRDIYRGDGNIALQAANGQYVCAEGGGGQQVVADRNAIFAWETFRQIPR
ncbi:MAG: SdrD B-like domain-containing protein [Methanotrichaceae archaeon]|jgi:hypothetical protein